MLTHEHKDNLQSQRRITVLIVDDHPLIRSGIVSVLGTHSDITVVGEARDGADAIQQAEALRPSVAIIDLQMPEIDGVDVVKTIRKKLPETRIIILTVCDTDDRIFPGLRAGAHSYLLKGSSPDALVDAIRSVCAGGAPVEPKVAVRLLDRLNHSSEDMKMQNLLSERELGVLQLVADGKSNRQIAEMLYLSGNTIKSHLHRIFRKLEVKDRTAAVTKAAKFNLVRI